MHVQVLGSRGVPARHGGFETFAHDLSLFLVQRGHAVTVYCQGEPHEKPREDQWHGVRRVHFPAAAGARGTIEFDWKCVLHANREEGVALTLGYNTAVFGLIYRLSGHINITNMDGLEWKREKWSPLQRLWLRGNEYAGAKLSHHLIADHPEIGRHLQRLVHAEKISVIAYGAETVPAVNLGCTESLRILEEFSLRPNRYAIVVARLEPENSVLEIVQAFSARPRNLKLVVLGKLMPECISYHRQLLAAAGPEVVFPGTVYEKNAVQALRCHARAYLHGHRVGGTNPSLVEAMAAGNAVIAHDNLFTRWVAGAEAAYFHASSDLAVLLDQLLDDDKRLAAMRQASLARHASGFLQTNILPAYEALLQRFATFPAELPALHTAGRLLKEQPPSGLR